MKTNNKNFKKNSVINGIDGKIASIFDLISRRAKFNDSVVVREKGSKGSSCRGIICVYNNDDIKRQSREAAAYGRLSRADRELQPKPFVASPRIKYAFYQSVTDATKIGSVAVYGESIGALCMMIKNRGEYLDLKVKSAEIEMGAKPFINVKFAV